MGIRKGDEHLIDHSGEADNRGRMIYTVCSRNGLVAETDDMDLVKHLVKHNPGCTVKDVKTGKDFQIRGVKTRA